MAHQRHSNAVENFFSVLKSHIQKDELVRSAALLDSVQTSLSRYILFRYSFV